MIDAGQAYWRLSLPFHVVAAGVELPNLEVETQDHPPVFRVWVLELQKERQGRYTCKDHIRHHLAPKGPASFPVVEVGGPLLAYLLIDGC
jgi:hypothetical protein